MSELDVRSAQEQARAMHRYVESFNGQKFCPTFDNVDRQNLATALDNLQETAAMLGNVADRLAAPGDGQRAAQNPCSLCNGRGSYGMPGARCEWCKGTGKALAAPGAAIAMPDPAAYLVDWTDIGEGTAQSLFYGDGAKEHMEGAVRFGWNARKRLANVTPLYASPAAAPTSQPNAAAQEQQAGWLPIATAPKYVPIRLYAQGGDFHDEDFNPSGSVEGHWSDDTAWCGAFWNPEQDCWDRRDGIVPTHWQPLPDPPATAPTGMGSVGLPSGRGEEA